MIWLSAADERAAALHAMQIDVPLAWRQNGLVLRIVFFCITAFAIAAFGALTKMMQLPSEIITALVALTLAEVLIVRYRFFRTGIELALWLMGALFVVFALPSSGKPEALLVVGAAIGLAGLRMREALFGAAAIAFVVIYAGVKTHSGGSALVVASVITVAAAVALTREWERRSTEDLFAAIALLVPPAGAATAMFYEGGVSTWAAFAILAAVLLYIGIRARDRVLLIATAIVATIAAADASWKFVHIAWEWKLIDAGLVALAIAIVLSRLLRNRTNGFITNPEAAKSYAEAIQLLGAMHAGQPAQQTTATGLQPGGGSFGGAGASGGY